MIGCMQCTLARRSFLQLGAMTLAASAAGPALAQSARAGIIDFHTHMITPDLPVNLLPSMRSLKLEQWLQAMREPRLHIEHMERVGVGSHVVSFGNATQGISWGDAQHDLRVVRGINDRIARDWVARNPGRFHGAATLPTQDVKLAIGELERAVTTLGFRVLQISSNTVDGIYYGDPRMDPLWRAIEALDVTVFVHPHGQENAPPLDQFSLANSVGQGIAELKVMTSIIYNGVFEKFPKVKIVVAHGGGFLPHYYGRLDRNAAERPETGKNLKKLPSEYLKSFYFDSCVYSPAIMAALIEIVGVERIVLGGDVPVGEPDPVAALRRTPGLTPAQFDMITRETPSRLLAQRA